MYGGIVDDIAIVSMLKDFGLPDKDIITLPYKSDDALLKNDADVMSVYLSNQPYLYNKQNIKLNIMKPTDYGIDFYGDMLFTSEDFVKNNPLVTKKFRDATIRGWKYALKHPKEVITWLRKKYPSKKSKNALIYEAKITDRLIDAKTTPIGSINKERVQKQRDFFKEHFELTDKNNFDGFYLSNYLGSSRSDHRMYLYASIAFVLVFLLFASLLFNKRLKGITRNKIAPLDKAHKKILQYVTVIDKRTISTRAHLDGKIIDASDAYCRLVGFDKKDILGKKNALAFEREFSKYNNKRAREALKNGENWEGEVEIRSSQNKRIHLHTYIEPIKNKAGDVIEFISVSHDITSNKELKHISETDSLTELPNRDKVYQDLANECFRSNKYNFHFSIILIDLDNFNDINESIGHLRGDKIIKEVAALFESSLKKFDACGRWEGKKFIIISPSTDLEEASLFAEKLRTKLEASHIEDVNHLTASFGIAEYQSNESLEDFMDRANKALKEAKLAGKNRCHIAENPIDDEPPL